MGTAACCTLWHHKSCMFDLIGPQVNLMTETNNGAVAQLTEGALHAGALSFITQLVILWYPVKRCSVFQAGIKHPINC